MKTLPITRPILALLLLCLPLRAEDEIEKAFRDALYAEEVKGDTEAALKAYAEVAAKFEQQRDMAATALFRQAECLRKLGRKDEAAAMYKKVLAQYGDKERTAKLSRENLAALGMAPADSSTTSAEQGSADVARLEKLLKDSPDLINATDASNPLAAAAEKGQVAVVDYLLGKGARVDTLVDGKAALHRAAEAGHLTVCQKLIEKGADVNLKTAEDASALLISLDKGRLAVAELLLDKKADVNAGKLSHSTPAKYENQGQQHVRTQPARRQTHFTLSLALARGTPMPLVLRLIEAGADPAAAYEETEEGAPRKTFPLAYAIRARNSEVLSALLSKSGAPNGAVDGEKWAMDLAMSNARPSAPDATDDPLVELLRKNGGNLKRSEVMTSAVRKGFTGYIRAAAQDGAEKEFLTLAVESKQPGAVKVLIELGADPARQNEYGWDAMLQAVSQSDMEMMTQLRAAGYPQKDRLARMLKSAALEAAPTAEKPGPAALSIYDELAQEAKSAGVFEEALTAALDNAVSNSGWSAKVPRLLAMGANAAKSQTVTAVFQNENHSKFGLQREDYELLWKSVRIQHHPDLKSAVWASRGPSVRGSITHFNFNFQSSGNERYRPFFRAIVSETGIVPAGTLGRFLAAYGWDSERDDLASLTVYRLDSERKLQETKVDFAAIAKAGDAAKDIPLQWGDVVEIPPRPDFPRGVDSVADATRQAEREAIFKFIDALYSETDVRLLIGDGQLIVNAENEKGPVLRMKGTRDPLAASGLPATSDPLPELETMSAGQQAFTRPQRGPGAVRLPQLYISHGDSVRIVPPAQEPALNDAALRNAFTFAVSDKGPYLRAFPEILSDILKLPQLGTERGSDLLRVSPAAAPEAPDAPPPVMPRGLQMPQEMPTRSLRDVLLMLRGPNFTGFGPVNWPAAKLRLASQDGWEELALDKADLSWPVVPGMMLILPPLDPAAPIPPDTFDYAACAMEVEVTPGDLPPFKLRFQPPVPELKRAGDKWLWSYKRKDGDSPCAWPDLYILLKNAPTLKDWPSYTGEITLKSGQKVNFDSESLQNSGGLWLQPDWKGISLTRKEPLPLPRFAPAIALQPGIPINVPPSPNRTRVVLPSSGVPAIPQNTP